MFCTQSRIPMRASVSTCSQPKTSVLSPKVHVEPAVMLSIQPPHPTLILSPYRQYRGMSALMAASFAGHLCLVKYLVEVGGMELFHAASSVRTLNLLRPSAERPSIGRAFATRCLQYFISAVPNAVLLPSSDRQKTQCPDLKRRTERRAGGLHLCLLAKADISLWSSSWSSRIARQFWRETRFSASIDDVMRLIFAVGHQFSHTISLSR